MSTDIHAQSFTGARTSRKPGATQAPARPPVEFTEAARRQDDLEQRQFEKQAAELGQPTLARPALIAADEVDQIVQGYGTASGRLKVLAQVTGKRLDYWTETNGGGAPFDPLTAGERAKAQAFFEKHPARLLSEQRQAPANPVRRERLTEMVTHADEARNRAVLDAQDAGPARVDPAPPPAAETPVAKTGPSPVVLTDPVGGATRGLAVSPPSATLEIEFVSRDGFTCRLTLHAPSGTMVLEQGGAAMAKLVQQQARPPAAAPAVVVSTAPAAEPDSSAPLCAIHHTPMERREGKNGKFWSCPKRLDDGSWCPYKPK